MMLQNPEFLLLLPLVLLAIKGLIKGDGYGKKISIFRIALITLLIAAAAAPSLTQTQQASAEQNLNILVDNTTSTQVLEESELPEDVSKTVFASGNSSQIFSQATSTIERGSYNLLVTDGQTDEKVDDLVGKAESKNATVSVYKSEVITEHSVKIDGPSTTVPEAQNSYTVRVKSSEEDPAPMNITLDDEVIFSGVVNESYSFQRKFDSKGEHTIRAQIESNDVFEENNHYYKTVEVKEKPKILSIGGSDLLEDKLGEFYEIDNRQSIPENLEDYYTVLMKEPLDNQELRNYLADGNGLVYTGEMDDSVPEYLPIRKSTEEDGEAGAKIIVVIDVSQGTACGNRVTLPSGGTVCEETSISEGAAKESIQVAYSLIDSLDKNNEIGVLAYNKKVFSVSNPKPLAFSREKIKSDISRIIPGDWSQHDLGLRGANTWAEENDTVVMLTDGVITGKEEQLNVKSKSRRIASSMSSKLITVGVGEDPNKPFLEDIAELANGYYLDNDETGRLKFRFGAGGGESEYTPVKVVNPNHFITEDVSLQSTTTGFKPVKTKSSAKKLVTGSNGKDFLSTWRYGLGRVASFSAGQKSLERTVNSDPELVSRTFSWAVGNPQRKQDKWLDIEDASRPENPEVTASYQEEGLTRQSENLYSTELSQPSLGFHEWNGETYAYNYHPEKEGVGFNEQKLQQIAQKTGGEIFGSNNIDQISQRVEEEQKTVEKQISLAPYLLGLALLVFLAEVGFRKRSGRI